MSVHLTDPSNAGLTGVPPKPKPGVRHAVFRCQRAVESEGGQKVRRPGGGQGLVIRIGLQWGAGAVWVCVGGGGGAVVVSQLPGEVGKGRERRPGPVRVGAW